MTDVAICGKDLLWVLSTDFGRIVFIMAFLTWGLIIVDLFLSMLILVHRIFGKRKKEN